MADSFAEYPRRDYPDRYAPPPEFARAQQRRTDLEHLRLLGIFHYVLGGLAAVAGFLPIIHLTIGIIMVSGEFPKGPNAPPEELRLMGWFFIGIAVFIMALSWGMAAALVWAGRCLRQQRRYLVCMVVACLACLQMPLGTVLGVFTIIVLCRESVKELFREKEAQELTGHS